MSERSEVGELVQLEITKCGGRVLRNQVGLFYTVDGRPVKVGIVGASDYIGWLPVLITADMVGKTIAQFLAVETKMPEGKTKKERLKKQLNFILAVNHAGGKAFIARSAQETREHLKGGLREENNTRTGIELEDKDQESERSNQG